MHIKAKSRICVLALCTLAATQSLAAGQAREPALSIDSQALVYGYDEMFDFDIDAWLARRAPHLRPHAEVISHWAGYSSISPKVLIALMEQQSKAVSRKGARSDALSRPFGNLSKARGFNAQTRDVALTLREALYELEATAKADQRGPIALNSVNPLQVLQSMAGESEASAVRKGDVEFQQVYAGLFNGPRRASAKANAAGADPLAKAASVLQFPFPVGQTWYTGGPHTNTGSGTYPMSSLDMYKGGGWGSNQSSNWIVASTAGTFKRHSSCYAEVVGSNGISTTYYHMTNLQYATGATVASNAAIGNPANTQAQAPCNGGQSTGPHVHWSLKYNGSLYHLNGVTLHDYVITATSTTNYDTNCSRFYLTRNGVKKCAGAIYAH